VSKRIWAILAALTASSIYGINHTLAKGLMPDYIKPFGFILLRVSGAAILFWIVSFFVKTEKIQRRDWPRMLACALFGMVINMLLSFKGLSLTTPINSSVIATITPILVFVLSAILIREKITWLKSLGAILGLIGALLLIFFSQISNATAPNIPLGNTLIFINAVSFGLYLIVVRPLTARYSSITLLKWFFLFAFIINFPITISEFKEVQWQNLPFSAIWRMIYVVVGTTFLTYLLNMFALKELSASTVGVFIYLQPVIAISFAMLTGADQLTLIKVLAIVLVFLGVYTVSSKRSRKRKKGEF
jgi:drug/metabolite transporter (DMT)-like permease